MNLASPIGTAHLPIAVVGGGLTGMSTAVRLAMRGRQVTVFEAHRTLGGCSGYFRRRGFAFDVGCTTLVDYAPGGVGGLLMEEIGLPPSMLEHLPGYVAWLRDERVTLHADMPRWRAERTHVFGDTPGHRKLWTLLDRLSEVFSGVSRRGPRMPIAGVRDLWGAATSLPVRDWTVLRYLNWTLDDAIAWAGLKADAKLRAFMAMIAQDTVHNDPSVAPLVNASLGVSIRGAIARPKGGMFGFWAEFEKRAVELGVDIRHSAAVESVRPSRTGERGRFHLTTAGGEFTADAVVCTLPIWDAARIGPPAVGRALDRWMRRDETALAGAALLTMGVPDDEVVGQDFTHHQFLPEPGAPLGSGNNCFLSISSPGDELSAPAGWRAVMLSTHVSLDGWHEMPEEEHARAKAALGDRLLNIARTAYPRLGERAQWLAVASPRTYAKYTRRYRGSVGGTCLTLANSNQNAVPHDIGVKGWIQAGDTTWPGLGTTACMLCSRIAAEDACRLA